MIEKVNLSDKFSQINDHWNPRIAGSVNNFHVKLVKLQGEFVWHHHDEEDELFFVAKGRLLIKLRDGDLWIDEGEFAIIPHGVEHCPVAEEEVHLMLFEPAGTLNTGTAEANEFTVSDPEQI